MHYKFRGLIFGGAYTQRDLFSEYYSMVFSQLTRTGQNLFLVRYFWPVLNTEQADPGRNILLLWGDQEIFFVCSKYISSAPWISTVYGFWAPLKLIFSRRAMPKEEVFVV